MSRLLKIGEFATLARVSVKALRFYESEGLFRPAYVDPSSAYRYYRIDQAAELALVTNLRAAGFTITEIASMLRSGLDTDTVLAHLARRRELLVREQADIDDRLAVLDTLKKSVTGTSDDPLSAVRMTSAPEQKVYSISAVVPNLGEPVTEMFERAERTVAAAEARSPTAPFLVFHDPPSQRQDLRVEVCIPLTENAVGRLNVTTIAACRRSCSVIYAGSYEQTEPLRQSLLEWIEGVGLAATGPLREVFHRFGADEEGYRLPASLTTSTRDEFITELLLPVAGEHLEEFET